MQQRYEVEPLASGTIVGGAFRVLRPLTSAATGLLHEVEELATRARRALEVMRVATTDPDLVLVWRQETGLAAHVPSDRVARPVDAGRDDTTGRLYLVTEALDGSTLDRVVAHSGAFPWTTALSVLEEVGHGVGAAHARGILHRGLEPANVFLRRTAQARVPFSVKILELGVAKALSTARDPGSPTWMAPEQLTPGADLGPQADIWAMGLLSFLVLTGQRYFPSAGQRPPHASSPHASSVWREVLVDPLVPASERAARLGVAERLPPGYDDWFARCVHRDPERRFPEVALALQELAALGRPGPASRVEAAPDRVSPVRPPPIPPSGLVDSQPPAAVSPSAPPPPDTPSRWAGAVAVAVAALVGAAVALVAIFLARTREEPGAATAIAAASAPHPGAAEPGPMRLHGSNTIGAELAPALAEAFLRQRTGAGTVVRRRTAPDEMVVEARDGTKVLESVEIAAHGSATAFDDLGAATCDIGMASRRIHPDEARKLAALGDLTSAATEHVIALDGIAVIVNPVNPISQLTKRQIADIFSGKLRRWSDVYWKPDPIVVHARDDRSGTYDIFRNLVLEGRPLAEGALRHEASDELSDAVAADPDAIGFVGLPYVRSAKAVMVQEEGSVPLLPSPLTVSTEDYPLTRRLYLYAPLGAPTVARDFIDFAQSEDGQKVAREAGFVDLRPECDPNASHCTSCTREYADVVRGACRLSTDFRFVRGSSQLDTRALRDLQRVAALVKNPEYAARSITLLGFADATGARADNVALSEQRAGVVADQLRARGLHVDIARGLGPDMPVSDNATAEGRERNRRVEVWLR